MAGLLQAPDVRLIRDEADAALAVLRLRAAGTTPGPGEWRTLRESEGYRRLLRREAAMGRPITDSAFQAFLMADSMPGRVAVLARTLEEWTRADMTEAGRKALAYLPSGGSLRATVYPLIKPRPNSFVFDTGTDSAAIFLYLDPAVSRAKLENTVAHELHHVGYAVACSAPADSTLSPVERTARQWISAFGEGIAVLAAAGGPSIHPHSVSDSIERARWEKDYAAVRVDLAAIESFLLDVLKQRVTDPVQIRARGFAFFGDAQGPWYTVGYLMGKTIEERLGRGRLLEVLCDRSRFLRRYNEAAHGIGLPVWSDELLDLLR